MKNNIFNIVTSLISFVAILICTNYIDYYQSFSIFFTFLYFVILGFYFKYNTKLDKKTHRYSMILSILFSLMLSIGGITYLYESAEVVNIFNLKNTIYLLISVIGMYILLYKLFGLMFLYTKKIKLVEEHKKMTRKEFIFMILILLVGYGLYFIRFYPAIMTPDSYYVIHYANNFILSDFHTFGHTWFFGIFFHLGKILFDSLNKAVAFSIIIQMICMSTIFASGIRYLYNKGLKKVVCIIILLFYTFSPLHAYYSITLWRDILFGCSFVITLISIYEFVSSKNKIDKKYIILFIISMLIMLFFRNNGIYILLFITPFLIMFIKKQRMVMSILTISIICFYFIIKGPVFDYFDVKKTRSVEAFSIPLQQIARVIASGEEIGKSDKEYLENLFKDYDKVSSEYKTYISDPVKRLTDNDVLSNNKKDFFKTYFSLFTKYPNIYFEAYFLQTLGYWYPDVIYSSTGGETEGFFETEDVRSNPLTPEWYNNFINATTDRNIPLSNLIWSVGLMFMILLASSFVTCYLGEKKYLLCYVPLYGLWLSIMIATPVFCELRYVYGLFTCAPLLVVLPFVINNNKKLGGIKK